MLKILFVCTGNICRSPTAEAVLRQRIEMHGLHQSLAVDSAGTHGYHVGEPPDTRACAAAKKRHILMDGMRARKIGLHDFYDFDLILGLDEGHVRFLRQMAPKDAKADIALFLNYAKAKGEQEIPDPYYGSGAGFEYVLDLIETGADGLLEQLKVKSHVA